MKTIPHPTAETSVDVLVLGAGAAGLMCAIEAGKRSRSVLVIERNKAIGEKIRISGGGRCNFTNLIADSAQYLSENPHFCKSALARFTTRDFINIVERHGIAYHKKKLGQLFCDGSSAKIIQMLEKECAQTGVSIAGECEVKSISRKEDFVVSTNKGEMRSSSLVIATGGLSIPQLGATNFGYRIAQQFGLSVTPLRPGLVPLKFHQDDLKTFKDLSGVSLEAIASCGGASFRESILFTHRGISGPAILQVSSYWKEGDEISINLFPDDSPLEFLLKHQSTPLTPEKILAERSPKRFAEAWCKLMGLDKKMNQYTKKELQQIAQQLSDWRIRPVASEGFGKAEVTVGGVNTDELSSKTMETKRVPGLYFIGEVVDVTGWLGGYNFQWAWASGWVAGQYC
ncbi:MAG TPA: NAD(P)/FAD-dependent oxidoreductase [Bacteroidota bacterium]|nr:NAD(P)/FAD-dependent oxidoreductase [Bacteroidota bacterium]